MTITWLEQSDFSKGTRRIRESGVYKLKESIVFHNDKRLEDVPSPPEYPHDPFHLGFFTAITIEADGVTLDLNGYTISQSDEHKLSQRFFSLIELSDRPFVGGQGPSNFGKKGTIGMYKNITIMNGSIGQSSHHGIHGNGAKHVMLKNLHFKDQEVAAISLNGCEDLVIEDVKIKHIGYNVPVRAAWSASRFIGPFMRKILTDKPDSYLEFKGGKRKGRVSGKHILDSLDTDDYTLEDNIIDGNTYGIMLNVLGVAVNGLKDKRGGDGNSGITLKNVTVKDVKANVTEVPLLAKKNAKANQDDNLYSVEGLVKGPIGDAFDITRVTDEDGRYYGNALSDAQIFNTLYGSGKIPKEIIAWALSGETKISDIMKEHGYRYLCNGDFMNHVQKGVFGIIISGGTVVRMEKVRVSKIENVGKPGSSLDGSYEYSHPKQTQVGYCGCTTRGICLASSSDVMMKYVKVSDIHSTNGDSIGIERYGECKDIGFNSVKCSGVRAGNEGAIIPPTPTPSSIEFKM